MAKFERNSREAKALHHQPLIINFRRLKLHPSRSSELTEGCQSWRGSEQTGNGLANSRRDFGVVWERQISTPWHVSRAVDFVGEADFSHMFFYRCLCANHRRPTAIEKNKAEIPTTLLAGELQLPGNLQPSFA